MNAVALAVCSLVTGWFALVVLCLRSSSQRHRLGLVSLARHHRWLLGLAGIALLAISLATATLVDGTAVGPVLWLCQLGLLGLAMVCVLPYAPGIVLGPWRGAGKGWQRNRE